MRRRSIVVVYVVPPDPSVHFYHCQYDITDGREIGNYIYRGLYIVDCCSDFGPPYSRTKIYAVRTSRHSSSCRSISLLPGRGRRPQQQTRCAGCCRSMGQTDAGRGTDGRTDTRQFYDAYRIYYADRIIRTTVPVITGLGYMAYMNCYTTAPIQQTNLNNFLA